jgi:hypothetical protein
VSRVKKVAQDLRLDTGGSGVAAGLVGSDVVEDHPVVLGLTAEVFDHGYLLVDPIEVLVLQGA